MLLRKLNTAFFLGVISAFLLLSACGKNETFNNMKTEDVKKFISNEETGFILFLYTPDSMESNESTVKKALDKNKIKSGLFNYREEVSNEDSKTFHSDVGTEQLRNSLGYYENGVLMAEFEMPNTWNNEQIDNLNRYITQITK